MFLSEREHLIRSPAEDLFEPPLERVPQGGPLLKKVSSFPRFFFAAKDRRTNRKGSGGAFSVRRPEASAEAGVGEELRARRNYFPQRASAGEAEQA